MFTNKWITLVFVMMLAMPAVYPQQGKAADAAKRKEQLKQANKKAYEKARKMTLKHRREIQTKATRKRMDEADKRAETYNSLNNKRWWEKLFSKHHRK